MNARPDVVLGVFVGGASRRMGGRPKGLLPAPDTGEPLVARLLRLGVETGLEPVLVGDAAPYVALAPGIRRLADAPAGIGPLGGLAALLAYAGARPALALACDMPYVTAPLLARLAAPGWRGAVVAPRREPGAPLEPLCARYDPPRVREPLRDAIARGVRSFQALLREVTVEELPLALEERDALRDWDAPGDLP